jgi:hypothetical protein
MLPDKAENPVEIKLHKSQINIEDRSVDPRIFPRRSFSILYGGRNIGKTVLLAHLIKDFYLPKKTFPSGILILTPSSHDNSWNTVRDRKNVTMLSKCNDDLLFDLIDAQDKALKAGTAKDMLLCVDDYASQGRGLKALAELATRGRHLLTTVIITTQYAKLLPPAVRQNATNVLIFRIGDDEIETLGREGLRCLVPIEDFVQWVKRHTHEPRTFVHINTRCPSRPFRIGFS